MSVFHDEEDGPEEPFPGLPENLPDGEAVLWQGSASPKALILHAFHVRGVAIYFGIAVLVRTGIALGQGTGLFPALGTGAVIAGLGAFTVGVLSLMGWAMARRSLMTITTRRVVFRHGVGIRKYVNVPFGDIVAIGLRQHGRGVGDIALTTDGKSPVPYFHLWPFARPLRITKTVPLMRSLPDVQSVAQVLVGAMKAHSPSTVSVTAPGLATRPQAAPEHVLRPGALAAEA